MWQPATARLARCKFLCLLAGQVTLHGMAVSKQKRKRTAFESEIGAAAVRTNRVEPSVTREMCNRHRHSQNLEHKWFDNRK